MKISKAEARSLLTGSIPQTLIVRLEQDPDTYCGVCGEDDCSDDHLDDEDLVRLVMGFAMGHPDGFCRKCGSCKTLYEMDTDGYECDNDECLGLIRHPAYHMGIMA